MNFRLDQSGEHIGLFASGGTQIDAVIFEPQFDDLSQGRFPDGPNPIYFLATPTPSAPNSSWANRYPILPFIADATTARRTDAQFQRWRERSGCAAADAAILA